MPLPRSDRPPLPPRDIGPPRPWPIIRNTTTLFTDWDNNRWNKTKTLNMSNFFSISKQYPWSRSLGLPNESCYNMLVHFLHRPVLPHMVAQKPGDAGTFQSRLMVFLSLHLVSWYSVRTGPAFLPARTDAQLTCTWCRDLGQEMVVVRSHCFHQIRREACKTEDISVSKKLGGYKHHAGTGRHFSVPKFLLTTVDQISWYLPFWILLQTSL